MLELIRPRRVISATRSDVPNRPRSTTSSRKRASGSWSAIPVTPRLKAATVKTKLTNKLAQRATNRNRVKQPNLRSAMAGHQAGGEQWGAQVDSEANPGGEPAGSRGAEATFSSGKAFLRARQKMQLDYWRGRC